MSIQLKTINLVKKIAIHNRDVDLYGKHIQSVNIYQTDGSFITTEPFNNRLVWYPQSPYNAENTTLGEWKVFDSFAGYGDLFFPLDARFDYTRRILWIADSGNLRILKVDINSGTIIGSIENGYFAHSVVINVNNGNIYVKSIKSITTGIIQCYDLNGILLNSFEFDCDYSVTNPDMSIISYIPLPSSMTFDHVRNRLWWVGDEFVYMIDVINKNIVPNQISLSGYNSARGVDVDFASGNSFVIAKYSFNTNWYILQIFRDNNQIVSTAYITKTNPSYPVGNGLTWNIISATNYTNGNYPNDSIDVIGGYTDGIRYCLAMGDICHPVIGGT